MTLPEGIATAAGGSSRGPLYVDLDGTLVCTDTLWESVAGALVRRPAGLAGAFLSLTRGRARFKRAISELSVPRAELLPYNQEVLEHISIAKAEGRRVVLATAADRRVAESVAGHLGLFDSVLASDGERNLKGVAKLDAIRADAGGPFDYIGDSAADLPVFSAADKAVRITASGSRLQAAARLMRPHQWAKNFLIFVPILTSHSIDDLPALAAALVAFAAFCLAASGVYVINDLLDVEADRAHPRKRTRPLAAGDLTPAHALPLAAGLLSAAILVSVSTLPLPFSGILAAYLATSQAYSVVLKRVAYRPARTRTSTTATRVLAGALAAGVALSPWLLAFSGFFFLSLAYAKRYGELELWRGLGRDRARGRDYGQGDATLLLSLGGTSGYLAVLVLALYVNSDMVRSLYGRPFVLWLLAPFVLFWITRVWLLVQRGQLGDDPLVFALRDRTSYAVLLGMLAVVAAARPI